MQTLPRPSTMQSAQDRSDTSKPTKYSIFCLPILTAMLRSYRELDLRAGSAQLRMLSARTGLPNQSERIRRLENLEACQSISLPD